MLGTEHGNYEELQVLLNKPSLQPGLLVRVSNEIRGIRSLELELLAVLCSPMQVLGTEVGSLEEQYTLLTNKLLSLSPQLFPYTYLPEAENTHREASALWTGLK